MTHNHNRTQLQTNQCEAAMFVRLVITLIHQRDGQNYEDAG